MSEKNKVSEELLSRYIDGNVTADEALLVKEFLMSKEGTVMAEDFVDIINIASEIEYAKTNRTGKAIDPVYSRSILDKENLDDTIRYKIAGHGKVNYAATSENANTCAIQAQQLILQDYGVFVSDEELLEVAVANGWYVDEIGSPFDFIGELLNYYNVQSVQMRNANIYYLMQELSKGHRIIVGVDDNDLSQTQSWRNFDEVIVGQEANHVLMVAGIDTRDPQDVKVIVTDPANDDISKSYPAEQFLDAWRESGFFMVATTTPAPLQYNPEMLHFDYQLGYIEKFADVAYNEIIKRLAEDGYINNGNDGGGKKYRIIRRIIFSVIIPGLALLLALFLWRYFTPFDMKIMLSEDSVSYIPAIPFEKGDVSVQFGTNSPVVHAVCANNPVIVFNDLGHQYRGKDVHIIFISAGYLSIDTIVPIQKCVNLTVRRDKSLGKIFGTVIDSTTGLPIPRTDIYVRDIHVLSDSVGCFSIDIPFANQDKQQELKAVKSGYKVWLGTYRPSGQHPWEIVLER